MCRFLQVRESVRGLVELRYPCNFTALSSFQTLGALQSHEQMRDGGLLKVIDKYDSLLEFVSHYPTIFCSHQW